MDKWQYNRKKKLFCLFGFMFFYVYLVLWFFDVYLVLLVRYISPYTVAPSHVFPRINIAIVPPVLVNLTFNTHFL